MSRTFAEGAEQKARALREARAAAARAAAKHTTVLAERWAPRLAIAAPQDIAAQYEAHPSAPGAALYAAVLRLWLGRGTNVAAQIENAKNDALGLPADVPAATAAAAASRKNLHPIQAMGITFGLVPGPRVSAAEAAAATVAIDATLPQATTAVRYNIAPLVDPRAGPAATVVTGLNYRLVERLVTISEDPVRPGHGPAGIRLGSGRAPRIVRTIDGGATFRELRPPQGSDAASFSAVGAGPKPRVLQLGALLEAAVFGEESREAGRVRTLAAPESLLDDFAARVRDAEPPFTADALAERLIADFAAEFDRDPPETADDFRAAVLGERRSRDPYRTYIAQALATVSERGADARLLRHELARGGGAASLYGSQAAAARGTRRELMLTGVSELRASILAARRQLAQAFDRLGVAARARAVFARVQARGAEPVAPRSHATAAAARRRAQALALYRVIVDEAFLPKRKARRVEKLETVVPRLTLKEYVLTQGASLRGKDRAETAS